MWRWKKLEKGAWTPSPERGPEGFASWWRIWRMCPGGCGRCPLGKPDSRGWRVQNPLLGVWWVSPRLFLFFPTPVNCGSAWLQPPTRRRVPGDTSSPPNLFSWGDTPHFPPSGGRSPPAPPVFTLLWEWRGQSPLPGGLVGIPPREQIKGRAALSCNPATRGTLNPGKPPANEGGEKEGGAGGLGDVPPEKRTFRGWRGRSPLPGGMGGVPPEKPIKGARRQPSQPGHEGDP